MKSDFFAWSFTKSSRVETQCRHCTLPILVGAPKVRVTGMYAGQFFCTRAHPECMAASQDHAATMWDDYGADDNRWLYELEDEDLDWLQEDHWIAVGYVKRARALARIRRDTCVSG